MNKLSPLVVVLVLAVIGGGVYWLFSSFGSKEQTPSVAQTTPSNNTPNKSTQPLTSTSVTATTSTPPPASEETIRWVTAGLGDWENDKNWEDVSSKAHRLPTEQDIVFVPKMLEGRTVSVQIAEATVKTVKKLINEGTIAGHRNEKNPKGSIELRATAAIINRNDIQAESDPNGEGGSVVLSAPKFDNFGMVEAGDTNVVEIPGGSVTIDAEIFMNKSDVHSGKSEKGNGGAVQISGKRLTNHKRITAGRSEHEGSAGGEIAIKATEYFSQYDDARLTAGKSAEKREESPPPASKKEKKQPPKITYLGKGGGITIQAPEVNIFNGRLTAGEGAPNGDITLEASNILTISSSKPRLEGNLIKLVALHSVSLLGLRKEALKSTASEGTAGIIVSTCERLDLQNNKGAVIFATNGASIQLGVPRANQLNILLDSGTTLEKLSKPTAQLAEPTQPCVP
ncbi:hypothetical protein HY230_00865 [Candidatus Acetothermia bacterium]|nr:hypothetical protein [Candidatus Acetothermia bacterium]